MLNLLEHYIWRSLPPEGGFSTHPNLRKKVDEQGLFLPYEGNTVVFCLDDGTKQRLKELREELYRAAPHMLAERLEEDTFHMTLHDLVNGPAGTPGLEESMLWAEREVSTIVEEWRNEPPLLMCATWMFNMMNTSIVLGFAPADGQTDQRLDGMYARLESVVRLGYDLTPHITLAYYRPGGYSQEEAAALSRALRPVDMTVELSLGRLELQRFGDMNRYTAL